MGRAEAARRLDEARKTCSKLSLRRLYSPTLPHSGLAFCRFPEIDPTARWR
jgi:hypothetical protein